MWILRFEDLIDGKRIIKNLKHGKKYHVGRDSDGSEFCIQCNVSRQYISKRHLTLEVKPKDINDVSKSTLSVTFETKASTLINGTKYKLRSNQQPYAQDFSDDLNIEFKQKNEKISISWQPFTVMRAELGSKLDEAYNWGLDIRTTMLPTVANVVLVEDRQQVTDAIGAHAMIYNIPIMTTEWLRYISDHDVDVLSPDITSRFMFRSNLSEQRGELFKGWTFQSADFRKELKGILEGNGGSVVRTNYELLDDALDFDTFIREKFVGDDKHIIYANSPSDTLRRFADTFEASIIGDESLYRALKDQDISNWKSIDITKKKRPASSEEPEPEKEVEVPSSLPEPGLPDTKESLASQSQWRRRKRIKKVDALAFLMPLAPSSSQYSQSATEEKEESKKETEKPEELEKPTESEKQESRAETNRPEVIPSPTADLSALTGIEQQIEDRISEVPIQQEVKKREPEPSDHTDFKRRKFAPEEILEIEDLEFHQETPEEAKHKEKKEAKKIKQEQQDRLAKNGLIEAIASTRDQLSDSIKQELDIDTFSPEYDGQTFEQYIESKLSSMAIVETVDLRPRSKSSPDKDKALYKGRKNFKKFRKNMPLKSVVTRTFIELQSPEKQMKKPPPKERNEPESQQLFVHEDDSQDPFIAPSLSHADSVESKDDPFIDDDDDRDDDDMPKFAFTS